MPYFTIRDAYGTQWSLTSSEPEVISGWLLEQARRASSVNTMHGPMTLTVNPIPLAYESPGRNNTPVYDWPIAGVKGYEEYLLQANELIELAGVLERFRQRKQIRKDTEMAGAEWCDFADHPFKAGSEGTMRMSQRGTDDKVTERVICPECAAELGLNPEYKAPEETPMQRRALLAAEAKQKK